MLTGAEPLMEDDLQPWALIYKWELNCRGLPRFFPLPSPAADLQNIPSTAGIFGMNSEWDTVLASYEDALRAGNSSALETG